VFSSKNRYWLQTPNRIYIQAARITEAAGFFIRQGGIDLRLDAETELFDEKKFPSSITPTNNP